VQQILFKITNTAGANSVRIQIFIADIAMAIKIARSHFQIMTINVSKGMRR
jgi:hypothetical protein